MLEAAALASLTSALVTLGNEYLKGVGGEAGKATWSKIKALFGWTSDPAPEQLPAQVAAAVAKPTAPIDELLRIVKDSHSAAAQQLVGNIVSHGNSKVVVAQAIHTNTFQM